MSFSKNKQQKKKKFPDQALNSVAFTHIFFNLAM